MFVECGVFPIGVLYNGALRTDYRLRPLTVQASMDVRRSDDFIRAESDDELMGLLSYAARLEIDGVPKEAMTLDLMLGLYEDDLAEIIQADGRLKEEIARFRGEKTPAENPGADAAGDSVGDGQGHGLGRGAAVAGDMAGDAQSEAGKQENVQGSTR